MSNNIVNNVDLDKISQTVNNGKRDKLTQKIYKIARRMEF
jgi:hypothetical protein